MGDDFSARDLGTGAPVWRGFNRIGPHAVLNATSYWGPMNSLSPSNDSSNKIDAL